MTVVVFCGPSIGSELVLQEVEAAVLPPAQRGDILRAALERPDAIALIDGYFDRTPSVWHKEILWAMSQGVRVFGASSMGALRAAELAPFGMVGVGKIFEAFANGTLEDDDEVAVAHGDAESGYRSGSEAMVNIRATLCAAEEHGVITPLVRGVLEARAKALPYHQRFLRTVLAAFETALGASGEIAALRSWLASNFVDQKRIDALAMLKQVATHMREGWPVQQVDYQLAYTDGWRTLLGRVSATQFGVNRPLEPQIEDELRVKGLLGPTLVAATMRHLAAKRLQQSGVELNPRAVDAAIQDFRLERGLTSSAAFESWLADAKLDDVEAEGFFRREAVIRATRLELRHSLGAAAEDELRASGLLTRIRRAAAHKAAILESHGIACPSLKDAGVTESELWAWHFRTRLGTEIPDSLTSYAASQASTLDDLRQSVLRDYLFQRLDAKAAEGRSDVWPRS